MSLGNDPRREPDPGLGPIVGHAANTGRTVAIVAAFVAAAGGLFLALNSHRQQVPQPTLVPAAAEGVATGPASAPPPPLRLPAPAPPPVIAALLPPPTPAPLSAPPPPPAPPVALAPAAAQGDAQQRLHAPAVVVDLGGGPTEPAKAAPAGTAPPTPSPLTAVANAQLGGEDQFAQRIEEATPSRARATTMGALSTLIPQGTIIPGVLETAIDSDLPGYTRGVVSRDVRSFDGKTVLIPRGSRLIGQYKSAVSQGATRAFVIWTRIIRSDGVSIQIGSPGEDPLGRAGLTGEVNRHFFTRFGGSILLSVLNAGVASVARSPTTTISIGSPGAAVGAASAVSPDAIPPTIKVAQGSAINIFVARDLDFSDVKAVK